MTRLEKILLHAQKLPDSLQKEVLDFVEYLEIKNSRKRENLSEKEWSEFSLAHSLKGIEEEPSKYTIKDIKEKF